VENSPGMNKALLIQLWIYLLGFMFSNLHKRTFDPVFRVLIAVPVGWAIFGISATLVYGVYFGAASQIALLFVLGLTTLALLIGNIISGSLSKTTVALAAVSLSVLAVVCIVVDLLRIVTMSPDSSYMARYGQNIGLGNYEASRMVFSMWGPFVPFIHSITNLLDQKLYWQYQPIISLHLVAIVFYTVYTAVREKESVLHSLIGATILICVMTLSDLFLFHVFYIHVNMISGLYMYLLVFAIDKMQQEPRGGYALLALLSLIAFSLLRIEAPLFAVAILLLTTFRKGWSYVDRLRLILPFTLFIMAWYARVYFMLPDNPDLLSKGLAIAIIAGLVGFGLFAVCSGVKLSDPVVKQTHVLTLSGLLLVTVAFTFVKPEHMFTSFINIVRNILVSGDWGLTWYVILFFATQLYFVGWRSMERHWLLVVVVGYCLLVNNLAYFTSSYRDGASDSGNRLVLQVLPLVILYLSAGVPRMFKAVREC
jgi:hypothetical protein